MRFFNTTGPCNPTHYYMLPATVRLEELNIDRLLAQKSYFILHLARRTADGRLVIANPIYGDFCRFRLHLPSTVAKRSKTSLDSGVMVAPTKT